MLLPTGLRPDYSAGSLADDGIGTGEGSGKESLVNRQCPLETAPEKTETKGFLSPPSHYQFPWDPLRSLGSVFTILGTGLNS